MSFSVKELSEKLGKDRTVLRRILIRENIKMFKKRNIQNGQQMLYVNDADANHVFELFDPENQKATESFMGWFYFISLIPELSPNRIKLGYAKNTAIRLKEHQCAAPTAEIIKQYPCKPTWEITAIDCITMNAECEQIGREVFDFNKTEEAISIANKFFEMMNAE